MRSFIALLLLCYIALAICQTPVAAPARVGDGRARTLKIFKLPGMIGVKAVAVSKMGGMTDVDAILAGASLVPFPTMGYSYFTSEKNASEDLTTVTAGRFSFAFRIVGLVEYVESGANDGYQPDEDTHVSYYTLRKELLGWETSTSSVNNNGQTVLTATASSKDGVISFTLAFSGDRTVYENKTLNGDNFKFSVTVDYSKAPRYSGRNDTSLAIVTIAAAKKSVKDIIRTPQSTSSSVEVPSDDKGIVGKLTWDSQVTATHGDNKAMYNLVSTVDSSLRNDTVALNVTTGWTAKVVYHSISLDASMSLGNTQLYWDPELGADIDYNSLGSASASSATSIIASIAVVISAIVALLA